MRPMREEARDIIDEAIAAVLPDEAVKDALKGRRFQNPTIMAIGKAAHAMAKAAYEALGGHVCGGIVITKYGHAKGAIGNLDILEAGHPVPDENTVLSTEKALALAKGLVEGDEVVFLISGGGSALFEKPMPPLTLNDIADVTKALLHAGAGIAEINCIRKRLSMVKGGRFAAVLAPAKVYAIVLSDVLGDRLDNIASGPCAPDACSIADALGIVSRYGLSFSPKVMDLLQKETPKRVDNVESLVVGSVSHLCKAAARAASARGYSPFVLTANLDCEAREAGRFMAAMARDIDAGISSFTRPCAIIAGGETVVKVKGRGKGGRNQELALAAAEGIMGLANCVLFSIGSDGTDGPTDAAGGMVCGETAALFAKKGIDIAGVLKDNDAYHALLEAEGLIITGPTGTNVNDVSVLLMR